MKLFFVSVNPVDVTKEITKEVIDAALGRTFDGKSTEQGGIFLTEADASEWASFGIKDGAANPNQHAVLTLETKLTEAELKAFPEITKGRDAPKITDDKNKLIKIIPCYSVPVNNFTIEKASFSHVAGNKVNDVVYAAAPVATTEAPAVAATTEAPAVAATTEAPAVAATTEAPAVAATTEAPAAPADKADDKATKTSAALDLIKKLATPVLSAGAIGTAFWYQGLVPAAVAALAKVGLVLPAASLATQIAIPAAVGLLAYAAGSVSWMAAKAVGNFVSSAWKKFNRTNKEKYVDDLAAENTAIAALEKDKLGLQENSSFVLDLNKLLDAAPEVTFDDKGVFAKDEPKDGNRLAMTQWAHAQLDKVVAAEEKDRKGLLDEVRKGPKPAAPK